MLARLWWKEWRAFGPAGLVLLLAAGGVQWLILATGGADVRSGMLTNVALLWAVVYAYAAGSAAFAGERDSGTMGFLDALPIGRPRLWLGKATFALASTLGLALLLAGLAALGTTSRDPGEVWGYGEVARVFGALLFEGVAWGLLWSSLSRNPLLAGAMSLASVFASALAIEKLAAPNHLLASNDLVPPEVFPWRMLAGSGALAASALGLAFRDRISFSSIAPTGDDRRADRRPGLRVLAASAPRSLDWQSRREGLTIAILVFGLGLGVPLASSVAGRSGDSPWSVILPVIAILAAGVAVFGSEANSATPRFLVHHGVRPGLVWERRLWIWGLAITAFLGLLLAGAALFDRTRAELPLIAAVQLDAFGVGLLCGMAIPRRITAVLVSVMGLLALAPVQVFLVSMEMIPAWALFLTPAILLGVSRGWVGDWMAGREGPRPWIRLGLFLVVPFGLLGSGYVAWRAWGEPDVGPLAGASGAELGAIPPGQDAAEGYVQASTLLNFAASVVVADTVSSIPSVDQILERGWDPEQAQAVAFWRENLPAIELAREAAGRPRVRFEAPKAVTDPSPESTTSGLPSLGVLLALDTRERQHRGDLPGAWEDILAQFRMANHLTTSPTYARVITAAILHHRAVALAIDWAGDPRQTADLIRKAGGDLKALPPLPSAVEALRVESGLIDQTLDLPADELAEVLHLTSNGTVRLTALLAPWWERIHARRLCRRLIAGMLPDAARDPSGRSSDVNFGEKPIGSPLARMIFPYFTSLVDNLDHETVRRRALEQVLALRSWQFAHGGQYPDRLESLVPSEMDRFPLDPYSGRPFGYVRSDGRLAQPVILPDRSSVLGPDNLGNFRPTRPGQFLLYSVGPDRKDDGGFQVGGTGWDILFPLP